MKHFSMGMAFVRQWLPVAVPGAPKGVRFDERLAVELDGTVGIARAGGDRIEASIAGRIRAQGPDWARGCAEDDDAQHRPGLDPGLLWAETLMEARRRSSGALAEADPFVWFQLLDDCGVPLTHETFLGRGVGIEYKVHARIEMSMLLEPAMVAESDDRVCAPRLSPSRRRLASGLHARILTRTYRNPSGPRYHMEVLVLMLLAAGAELPLPAFPTVPALALVPRLPSVPTRRAAALS